jgi:hypothetical protein
MAMYSLCLEMGGVFAGERLNHLIDVPSGKSKKYNYKIMKVCFDQHMSVGRSS